MLTGNIGPQIDRSALVIVDMQNDFVHPEGGFARLAREHPEAKIDMPFLIGTIRYVRRLAESFRKAGRPVVYVAHVLKSDYSDAAFPFWRATKGSTSGVNPHARSVVSGVREGSGGIRERCAARNYGQTWT